MKLIGISWGVGCLKKIPSVEEHRYFFGTTHCDFNCSLKERLKVEFAIYLCESIWKRYIFTPQSAISEQNWWFCFMPYLWHWKSEFLQSMFICCQLSHTTILIDILLFLVDMVLKAMFFGLLPVWTQHGPSIWIEGELTQTQWCCVFLLVMNSCINTHFQNLKSNFSLWLRAKINLIPACLWMSSPRFCLSWAILILPLV